MKTMILMSFGLLLLGSCSKDNQESTSYAIQEANQNRSLKLEYKVFNSPGETVQFGASYIYDGNLFKLVVSELTNQIIYTSNNGNVANFKFTETDDFIASLTDFEKDAFVQTFKRVANSSPTLNIPDPKLKEGLAVYTGEDDIIIALARCQVVSSSKQGATAGYSACMDAACPNTSVNIAFDCVEFHPGSSSSWITICSGEC